MASSYMGLIFVANILLIEYMVRRFSKEKQAQGDKVSLYKGLLISTVLFSIAWGAGDTILLPSFLLYIVIGQVLVIGYKRSIE